MNLLRPDLAAVAAMVPPGSRVLDIGCGQGRAMVALAAKVTVPTTSPAPVISASACACGRLTRAGTRVVVGVPTENAAEGAVSLKVGERSRALTV